MRAFVNVPQNVVAAEPSVLEGTLSGIYSRVYLGKSRAKDQSYLPGAGPSLSAGKQAQNHAHAKPCPGFFHSLGIWLFWAWTFGVAPFGFLPPCGTAFPPQPSISIPSPSQAACSPSPPPGPLCGGNAIVAAATHRHRRALTPLPSPAGRGFWSPNLPRPRPATAERVWSWCPRALGEEAAVPTADAGRWHHSPWAKAAPAQPGRPGLLEQRFGFSQDRASWCQPHWTTDCSYLSKKYASGTHPL